MTTNTEILRAYTRQFDDDGQAARPADAFEIEELAERYADQIITARSGLPDGGKMFGTVTTDGTMGYLTRDAERLGIPFDEYVGAVARVCAYTEWDVYSTTYEIDRVIATFRELMSVRA